MAQGSLPEEPLGAVALWRELRGYLRTETQFGAPEMVRDARGGSEYEAVKAKIVVTNSAPDDRNWPRIVFVGVGLSVADLRQTNVNRPYWARELRVERPAQQSSGDLDLKSVFVRLSGSEFPEVAPSEREFGDVLFPGQSIVYELSVPRAEMPYVQFSIEASLSRRHLLHYQHELAPPSEVTRPPVVSALRAFNAIALHGPLDTVVSRMPNLGPATQLSDMQTTKEVLVAGMKETEIALAAVNDVYRRAPNPGFRAHLKDAAKYLSEVRAALTRMQKAVAETNVEHTDMAAEGIVRLKERARAVNAKTEELLRAHNISAEEANYRYGGR